MAIEIAGGPPAAAARGIGRDIEDAVLFPGGRQGGWRGTSRWWERTDRSGRDRIHTQDVEKWRTTRLAKGK